VPTASHRIAGASLERLAALSDGIFAVVMTLLVLDLHVPVREGLHSEAALWHELGRLAPQLLTYLLSFLTLGIFWVGQQTQLNQVARSNRDLTWIHLGFLLAVSLMPFSTGLLAEFITFRLPLVLYWLNLLLLQHLRRARHAGAAPAQLGRRAPDPAARPVLRPASTPGAGHWLLLLWSATGLFSR